MTMSGYKNCVLRVDLTMKGATTEPLRMDWAENKLMLTNGPFTGTSIPCSGKLSVAAKSPATGTINDCSIGGHAGLQIKYAGYDAVIFEGKLKQPGYILIEDDKIQFKDASKLWGKGSHQVEGILANKYGHEYSIMSIGPAGENLVTMACINSDYYRQA